MKGKITAVGITESLREFIFSAVESVGAQLKEISYDKLLQGKADSFDIVIFCFNCDTRSYFESAAEFIKASCGDIPVAAILDRSSDISHYQAMKNGFDACLLAAEISKKESKENFLLWLASLLQFKMRMDKVRSAQEKKSIAENAMNIRLVYRDVILAVTRNKLYLILNEDELPISKDIPASVSSKIENVEDLTNAKEISERFFLEKGFERSKVFDIVVSVSEAVSNVLKHAQSGFMDIYEIEEYFYISISDNGCGIELSDIPRSVQKGHSSKASLGMGFSIMLELMDKIYLYTTSKGTNLVIRIPHSGASRKTGINYM